MQKKKIVLALFGLMITLVLTGCFPEAGDSLFAAPKPPGDYLALQSQIDSLVAAGAVLASPEEGENRHSVQMVDLDADGVEEVISFFKNASDTAQFTVYVYKKQDGNYVQVGSVEGHGLGIRSVHYPRKRTNGELAVIICWRMGEELNDTFSVCSLQDDTFGEQLNTEYTELYIDELSDSGLGEILSVTQNKTGQFSASLYSFMGDELRVSPPTNLSASIRGAARLREGKTRDGARAFFVDGISVGRGMLTDVLIERDHALENVTLDTTSGISTRTYRSVSVPATDLLGDGTYAIPLAFPLPGYSEQDTDIQWRLSWCTVDSMGVLQEVRQTYHNVAEGWYYLWPEEWGEQVTITRSTTESGGVTSFYWLPDSGEFMDAGVETDLSMAEPFLLLFVLTGEDQNRFSGAAGYIRIGVSSSATYYAYLMPGAAELSVTEDSIRECFRILSSSWYD